MNLTVLGYEDRDLLSAFSTVSGFEGAGLPDPLHDRANHVGAHHGRHAGLPEAYAVPTETHAKQVAISTYLDLLSRLHARDPVRIAHGLEQEVYRLVHLLVIGRSQRLGSPQQIARGGERHYRP